MEADDELSARWMDADDEPSARWMDAAVGAYILPLGPYSQT